MSKVIIPFVISVGFFVAGMVAAKIASDHLFGHDYDDNGGYDDDDYDDDSYGEGEEEECFDDEGEEEECFDDEDLDDEDE